MRHGRSKAIQRSALVAIAFVCLLPVTVARGDSRPAPRVNGRPAEAALRFRPILHRMPPSAQVLAGGNYTVLVPPAEDTGLATLVDQASGQSRTVSYGGSGCTPGQFSPPWLVWDCALPSSAGDVLENISTLETTPLPLGVPTELGSRWAQYDVLQTPAISTHSPTVRDFVDLTTGAVLQDSSTIGGAKYPDLDDPALYRTACHPVRLGGSFDGQARAVEPGSLTLFGQTAVLTDQDGLGSATLQQCGSHKVLKLRVDVQAHNSNLLAWIAPARATSDGGHRGAAPPAGVRQKIDGILPRSEQRFSMEIPTAIQQLGLQALAINSRSLYVQTSTDQSYRINLPAALR